MFLGGRERAHWEQIGQFEVLTAFKIKYIAIPAAYLGPSQIFMKNIYFLFFTFMKNIIFINKYSFS